VIEAKPTKNIILPRLLAGIIFGFLVLLALMLIGDIRQISQQVIHFRWQFFPLVLLLTLFNYTLRFFKWHYYLGLIGIHHYPFWRSARLFVAGFPLAITPGKVGEALKGFWLNKETKAPIASGVAVVLAERISDGLAVLVLSALGVIAYPRYWFAFLSVLLILSAFVIISQIRPLALYILDFGAKIPLVQRFIPSLTDFYEGSYSLFKPKATLIAVSLGTISWLGEGIGFYLILIGLGLAPTWQTLSIAVFVLAFSTVIGAISTLPGGLGAAEASIAGMLIFLLPIRNDTAATATLLIRFATLWFGISLGLIVWAFSPEMIGLKQSQSSQATTEKDKYINVKQ
jgi:glycosyltransferase 2 family protein